MKKLLILFSVLCLVALAILFLASNNTSSDKLSLELEQQLRDDINAFEQNEVIPDEIEYVETPTTTSPTSTTTNKVIPQNNETTSSDTPDDTPTMTSTAENGNDTTAQTRALDDTAKATTMVAGGCFWCVEADLEKLQGVLTAVSGYAGGTTDSPTYDNYDDGGHREVVYVIYNPSVVTFREILIYAIKHMDPTDSTGSFGDRGVEYSPALYYKNDHELSVIQDVIADINELEVYEEPLALAVEEYPTFWIAEDYHQNYYKGISALKYKYYRNASGRDDFIEKHWGADTGPTLPADNKPFEVNAWSSFLKPAEETLLAQLTPLQYKVTQKNGTEPAYENMYWDNHEEGIYVDIVSGEPLFSSTDKFDSGTGWPSFTKPIYPDAVTEHDDFKLITKRIEIRSAFADSHLGHRFNDAPLELGGIRYCMNSAALRFVPKEEMENEGYGQFLTLF